MSVIESRRKESTLLASVKAKELATYTLRITRNKKIFLLEYKEDVSDKIISDAINIFRFIFKANEIRVKDDNDWKRRSSLQKFAIEKCDDMLALIALAKPLFHLKTKRVEYWVGKIVEVRALIEKWHNRDTERYKHV